MDRADLYNVVLVLHILAVVAGFGPLMLNGVYGAAAKSERGAAGVAIATANVRATAVAQKFVYAVPALGVLLVLLAPEDAIGFGDTWVWLSLVLYVAALGVSHSVMAPAVRRMVVLMGELAAAPGGPGAPGAPGGGGPGGPPPQAAELGALGKRVGAVGAALNLVVVVILVLMVFKPGA